MMLAGGAMTALATIAVGGFVVVSSATALDDSPGRALAIAPIDLPARTATAPAPAAVAVPSPAATAQTVPAPAPQDVASPRSAPPAQAPAAEPAAQPPAPAPSRATEVAAALQRVREWAVSQGWDTARIDAFLADLEARYAAGENPVLPTPVGSTGHQSVPQTPSSRLGPTESRSSVPPDGDD